mmetsp:Transcript_24691/g.32255  ORF Transcript_24691/g.32255 Transcript_24691/m.32255 type:complete len:254 (-) Transcript_24691:113-874(-)
MRRHLPAPGRDDAVRDGDRANRAVLEPQQGGGDVFVFVSARRRSGLRLDAEDFPAQMPQQIDVMHQVHGNRPGPNLLSPRRRVKIAVGFVEPAGCLNRTHGPNRAAFDVFMGLANKRIVTPVMPNQKRNICLFGTFNQCPGRAQIICQRLFDQHRDTCIQAHRPLFDMQFGWRRQDDPVRGLCNNHTLQIIKPGNTKPLGHRLACVTWVDNSAQGRVGHLRNGIRMTLSHKADARNGQTQGRARCVCSVAVFG